MFNLLKGISFLILIAFVISPVAASSEELVGPKAVVITVTGGTIEIKPDWGWQKSNSDLVLRIVKTRKGTDRTLFEARGEDTEERGVDTRYLPRLVVRMHEWEALEDQVSSTQLRIEFVHTNFSELEKEVVIASWPLFERAMEEVRLNGRPQQKEIYRQHGDLEVNKEDRRAVLDGDGKPIRVKGGSTAYIYVDKSFLRLERATEGGLITVSAENSNFDVSDEDRNSDSRWKIPCWLKVIMPQKDPDDDARLPDFEIETEEGGVECPEGDEPFQLFVSASGWRKLANLPAGEAARVQYWSSSTRHQNNPDLNKLAQWQFSLSDALAIATGEPFHRNFWQEISNDIEIDRGRLKIEYGYVVETDTIGSNLNGGEKQTKYQVRALWKKRRD